MNKTEGANLRVILYEGAGSQPMDSEDRFKAISALLDNGFEVTRPAEGGTVTREDDSRREAGQPQFCDACFTSDYPTKLTDREKSEGRRSSALLTETA